MDEENVKKLNEKYGLKSSTDQGGGGATTDFKTLGTLGKVISFCGWLAVLAGVGVAIALSTGRNPTMSFFGIPISIMGLFLVAQGQMISCFVAIENHTKRIRDSIESRQ